MARSAPFLKREEVDDPSAFVLRGQPARGTSEPTPEAIRVRAYEIYLSRGGAPGREAEDWVQAERELRKGRGRPGTR